MQSIVEKYDLPNHSKKIEILHFNDVYNID